VVCTVVLATSAILFPLAALADTSGYSCTFRAHGELTPKGLLKSEGLLEKDDPAIGKVFFIDRTSGEINGYRVYGGRLKVVEFGSKQSSFKALPERTGSQLAYLIIEEVRAGDEKPFLYVSHVDVYTGICY
jgi:hypothetical protein